MLRGGPKRLVEIISDPRFWPVDSINSMDTNER